MFDEETLESVTMEILQDLRYECINGYEMKRIDFSKVLLEEDLLDAIERMNKGIEFEQIQEVIKTIRNLDNNNTILNNKQFTKYLLEGISVPIQEDGETKYKTIKIIDFENIQNNIFKAINQYTIIEHSEKRPDIIIFINGMPLVVVELKSTVREDVKLIDGYNQLKGYQEVHIPSLFYYNQFMIVSDGVQAKAGTITSPWSRFSEWKKVEDTDEVLENMPTHKTLFNGMLRKDRLLDIISNFILWSEDSKILSAYHQYFGVKKAITSTENAIDNKTGKAGLLWHTQGSGKSFSMVFYAGNMIKVLNNPSIVVVTDRNDLDNQLFTTFAKCSEYLKQEPVQIENRQDLNEKLEGRKSGGIFFTTLQKFEEETGVFSQRDDILVLVDEAHRSHYGLDATIKFDKAKMEAYKKYGTAKYLHDAFPNATYIGFTGTPVETKDRSTTNVFGNIKDMESSFKIAIVVDMWLTGFDVPGLGTMYMDKPMKAHNLMQAIARVNRVYKDKTGGLIVDYIGLKRWLLDALKTYTKRDQGKIVDNSELVKVLNDKVELIRDLFKGFYYGHFATTTDSDKYEIIMAGANWMLETEEKKKAFMKYSYDVKSLYALCTGALSQELKDEILFFIAVRSFISKLSGDKIDVKEINDNVAKMLERAIQDDEMLQIGEVHNSNQLALLSNEILNKLAKMQKKNIAVEVLNRALKEYVNQIGRQNVVMMEKFSTKFQKIAATYNERTSVEDIQKIIEELINLKNEIEEELKAGNEFNLSSEEKAFFDALGNDPEVKELMKDEILVQIAKELVETVNSNMTIDWDIRKDARAKMRIEIKKLLIKYNYPPNKSEKAVQTVIRQAELKCKEMIG